LIRTPLSTTSVLDEAADAVRLTAAPWAGLLVSTAIPYRFAQAIFADRLIAFGGDAVHYTHYLGTIASMTMAAFVLSRWGRLVFARAIRLASESGTSPGAEALRLSPAALFNYVYLSAIAELLSLLTLVTFVAPALCTMLSGLAVGTAELNDVPSIAAPFRRIARYGRDLKIVAALMLVFVCALAVAAVNVAAAFSVALWLAGAAGGWDVHRWSILGSLNNHRFVLMIIAGAVIALEPFWIAAHVTLVRKAGAAESGDDLRAWFEELRNA
jgi:hypothetical protein